MKKTSIKKNIIFVLIFLLAVSGTGSGQSLNDSLNKFVNNQSKIKTFIGSGSLQIVIKNSSNENISTMKANLVIYMKQPDMVKIVMDDGTGKTVSVQKGDLISQKIPGANTIMTNKVDKNRNLAKNFFFLNIDKDYAGAQVISSTSYTGNNKTYFQYRIKGNDNSVSNPSTGMSMKIDYTDVVFDENGLYVKNIVFSDNKEMITTTISYIQKEGISVMKKIVITTAIASSIMENIIEYNTVNINRHIADKEFDL